MVVLRYGAGMSNLKVSIFSVKAALFILIAGSTSSAFAQTTSAWQNAYTASNGTVWSNILPVDYANCISEKDGNGNAIVNASGFVNCEKNSAGDLIGDSSDGTTVQYSDAVQACLSIGGSLPTEADYQALGQEFQKLSDSRNAWFFWTASNFSEQPGFANVFSDHTGQFIGNSRIFPQAVRCIKN